MPVSFCGSSASRCCNAEEVAGCSRFLLPPYRKNIPFIIGSAGGSGAKPHVDATLEILREIAFAHKLHFKLAVIYSDISRDILRTALAEGRISPCGPVPQLTDEKIGCLCNPVGQ